MSIGGKVREVKEFGSKKVGLFEAKVIAINPSMEEFEKVLGITLNEDSKATEYLGEKDSVTTMKVTFWLEDVKSGQKFSYTVFLENKERENKDFTKKQYVDTVGNTCWCSDENSLPEWFKKREYRVAKTGEEDLYAFCQMWLGKIDYRDAEAELQFDWKLLMKGNVRELREQLGGEYETTFVALAAVRTKDVDGETKEYQAIYKRFLPAYTLKKFRLVDYDTEERIEALREKERKKVKMDMLEKFVLEVKSDEYPIKAFTILKDLKDYDPEENYAASEKVITEDGADF